MDKLFTLLKGLAKKIPIAWVLVYFVILGGATAFGANIFQDIASEQLPSGNIQLLTNKDKYQLGERIEFTVVNNFPVSIFVNNQCPNEPLNVYIWQNKTWQQIHDTAKATAECFDEERNVAIEPDGSRSYDFDDWPNLFKNPGVYRLAMIVDHSDDIFFKDFVILKPAQVIEVTTPEVIPPSVISTPPAQPEPQEEIKVYRERDYEDDYGENEEWEDDD